MGKGNMMMMAVKAKIDGMLDCLKYKEDEDPDGTALKANVFGRYLGLASIVLLILTGLVGMMPSNCETAEEDTLGDTAAEAEAACKGPGACPFAGVWAFLFVYFIFNMEIYHYCLPKEPPKEEGEDGASKEEEVEVQMEDADSDDSDDSDDDDSPGCFARICACLCGCCKKCRHRMRKCCWCFCLRIPGMKHAYENFYIRALVYIIICVPTFFCAITMAAGLFVAITGVLYAFARWRGEKERELSDPREEDPAPEDKGDGGDANVGVEPVEDPDAPKKGRRKKKK